MNPILIYENEVKLNKNNKFTLDFVDNNFVHLINFLSETQYYICSLSCNINKANKKGTNFGNTKKFC